MSASVSSGDSPPTDVTTKRNQMDLHTDAHVKYLAAFGKSQDDYEYHMSEHLRLNGIYWSLTALDMCHKLDESVDVDEVFAFVMACQHPSGGFGAAEGHDAHILFSLSAIQILLIINRIDQLDRRLVGQYLMGLQNEDGSFRGDEWGEVDTRFSFCALAGLSLLGFMHSSDPGAIDKGADTADKGTDAVDSGPVPTDKGTGADHGGVCSRSGSDTQDSRATGAGINIFALDLDKASTGTGNSNDNSTKHALDGLFEGEIDIQTGLVCEYADIDKAARFVLRCKNFDGGFGSLPGSETHAGQIYCCVGALAITKSLHHVDSDLLGWWLAERQTPGGGLNGRPEKLPDVCYSWWVMASLKMLKRSQWINRAKLAEFILKCQDTELGGFADRPGDMADPFHTLFGLAGLQMLDAAPELGRIDHIYCMPTRVMQEIADVVPVIASFDE